MDVFVRYRGSGRTVLASVSSNGVQENADSTSFLNLGSGPMISADGRCIGFESSATNMVPGDTNGASDVFLRDVRAGTTKRVSVSNSGNQGNGLSVASSVSANGRVIAFVSMASNLVDGDRNNAADVFVRENP